MSKLDFETRVKIIKAGADAIFTKDITLPMWIEALKAEKKKDAVTIDSGNYMYIHNELSKLADIIWTVGNLQLQMDFTPEIRAAKNVAVENHLVKTAMDMMHPFEDEVSCWEAVRNMTKAVDAALGCKLSTDAEANTQTMVLAR